MLSKRALVYILFYAFIVVLNTSCKTYNNISYFRDVPDSSDLLIKTAKSRSLLIEKGDILSVAILTLDPSANTIFSQQVSSSKVSFLNFADNSQGLTTLNTSSSPTYNVDQDGYIGIPLLGKFKALGISTDSLRNEIELKASQIYKSPIAVVRFANLRIGVLGEVNKPGVVLLTNERNTILDALTAAGDLSIYGKRENLILIRDSAGFTRMKRFSLSSKDLVSSDIFYLKQNDVIYVQPDKTKAAVLDQDKLRFYSLLTTGVTLLAALIYLFKR